MKEKILTFDQLIELFERTDIKIEKLAKQIAEQGKMINGIAESNGLAAETLISNTLENSLSLNGWSFDYADINVKKHIKGLNIREQFDLVLGKENLLAIVEIKYRVRTEDVTELANRKIPNYKKLFPNETRHIVGVVAGMSIDDHTIEVAKANGIYAITLSGDQIKVENAIYKEFV
ncbi:MAG: hypothetical protein NTW25_05975 [Candidatus Kapabacteria bacterium]|nr:hypothetical protein [Candidatus Kapabacteria bacterium]